MLDPGAPVADNTSMARLVRFRSEPLPAPLAGPVRRVLAQEHRLRPFSAVDPRETVRRVAGVAHALGLRSTVYRGAVDLRGAEIDHVWLELDGRVVDAAFPLLEEAFVGVLRRFVAGDVEADELAGAADAFSLDGRVLGRFPESIRYIGEPVWTSRPMLPPMVVTRAGGDS